MSPDALYAEAFRVLRPGGVLAVAGYHFSRSRPQFNLQDLTSCRSHCHPILLVSYWKRIQFCLAILKETIALCVKPLRNLALQGFTKMIPSAPIFPLSLSNSLSFASIPIVKIGKNYENFNFQTLTPFSQWRAALTNFSFSRYFLKKSSFFSTKKFKFVG